MVDEHRHKTALLRWLHAKGISDPGAVATELERFRADPKGVGEACESELEAMDYPGKGFPKTKANLDMI